jgi:Plant mobile domain
VERCRLETHTFHMLVGELTVTLQDVSCLWDLPITGDHIVGPSDRDLQQLIGLYYGLLLWTFVMVLLCCGIICWYCGMLWYNILIC